MAGWSLFFSTLRGMHGAFCGTFFLRLRGPELNLFIRKYQICTYMCDPNGKARQKEEEKTLRDLNYIFSILPSLVFTIHYFPIYVLFS